MKGKRLLIALMVLIFAAVVVVAAYASLAVVGPGPIPAPDGGRVYYLEPRDAWYMIVGDSATLHVDAFHPECGGRVTVEPERDPPTGNVVDVRIHTIIPEDRACAASGEYQWIDVVLPGTYDPGETYTVTVNSDYEARRVEPTPTPTPTPSPTPGGRVTPTPKGAHIP